MERKSEEQIAVLLPVCKFDEASLFALCLESVKSQVGDVRFFLCIGCDGPLTRDLEKVLESTLEEGDLIVRQTRPKGLASILNKMILSLPSIEVFVRIDADDIMERTRITRQLSYLKSNPAVDCVGSAATLIDQYGNELGILKKPKTHEDLVLRLCRESPFFHPGVCIRARFFRRVGLYNEELRRAQDYELWYRGAIAGARYGNIDEPLIKYRVGDKSNKGGVINAWRFLRTTVPYEVKLFGWKGGYMYIFIRAIARAFGSKGLVALAYKNWLCFRVSRTKDIEEK